MLMLMLTLMLMLMMSMMRWGYVGSTLATDRPHSFHFVWHISCGKLLREMRPDGTLCFRVSWVFVPCNYFFDVFCEMPVGCTVLSIFGLLPYIGLACGRWGWFDLTFCLTLFLPYFSDLFTFLNFLSDICVWHFFWHTSRHWFEIHIICVTFFRHISIFFGIFSEIPSDTFSYILPAVPAFFRTFF